MRVPPSQSQAVWYQINVPALNTPTCAAFKSVKISINVREYVNGERIVKVISVVSVGIVLGSILIPSCTVRLTRRFE